jgi:hypothetical protein
MKELICDVNGASSSEGLDLHGEGSSRHVLCGTEDGINEKRSALAAPDFQELVNRSQGMCVLFSLLEGIRPYLPPFGNLDAVCVSMGRSSILVTHQGHDRAKSYLG